MAWEETYGEHKALKIHEALQPRHRDRRVDDIRERSLSEQNILIRALIHNLYPMQESNGADK
eukprot:scaffold437298_cov45-Prasinocladus_malaysianus.AAC.1